MSQVRRDDDLSRVRASHWAILGAIMIVAAVLRFVHLGQPVYLLDEIWHAEVSTGRGSVHLELPRDQMLDISSDPSSLAGAAPWWKTWGYIRGWTHPPLYATALRMWRYAVGEGEAASRSLSVIASLVSILLIFDAARHLSSPRAALWTALLLCVAGSQVLYARELRNYVFAQMWLAGGGAAMARIIAGGFTWRRGAALACCALAAMLSHYFAVFVCAGLGIYALFVLRGRARWLGASALIGALVLFIAITLPILLKQQRDVPGRGDLAGNESGQSWQSDVGPGHVGRALRRFADLPLRLMVNPAGGYGSFAWCGLLFLVSAIVISMRWRCRDAAFWIVWYASATVPLLALDLTRSTRLLEFLRYPLPAGLAVCAISPLVVPHRGRLRWVGDAMLGLAVLVVTIALPLAYDKPTPDIREVAQYLDQNRRPGDVIAFYPTEGADWYAGNVWLGVAHYSQTLPWPTIILSKPAGDGLLNSLHGRTVWLVSGSQRVAPTQIIPNAQPLQRRYFDGTGTVTQLRLP